MPAIPTVPGAEIDVQTPERGVRRDAGALSQRAAGKSAIAAGLSSVGEVADTIGAKLQRANNARIAADVDLKLRSARQSFLESLRNDQDESGWETRAADMAAQVRDDIFEGGARIPPGMRSEVDSAVRGWQSALGAEVQTLARVQMVNRAWGKTKEDYAEKLRDGDAAGAMASLRLARDTQIANAAEVDQLERDIPRTIARNFIETGLAVNPKGTYDLLKSGAPLPAIDAAGKEIDPKKVLDPKDYQSLVNSARVRTDAWQSENLGTMLAEESDPETGYVLEDVIREKMKSGEIDERAGRNLINAQTQRQKAQAAEAERLRKAEEREVAAELRAVAAENREKYNVVTARAHDQQAWQADPDAYARALTTQAMEIGEPAQRQNALNTIAAQRDAVKRHGVTADTPLERQILAQMNEDRLQNDLTVPVVAEAIPAREGIMGIGKRDAKTVYHVIPGGLEGLRKATPEQIEQVYGKGVTREALLAAEQAHWADITAKMLAWTSDPRNKDATYAEANAYRQSLEKPFIYSAVGAALNPRGGAGAFEVGKVYTDAQGRRARWNGTEFVAP